MATGTVHPTIRRRLHRLHRHRWTIRRRLHRHRWTIRHRLRRLRHRLKIQATATATVRPTIRATAMGMAHPTIRAMVTTTGTARLTRGVILESRRAIPALRVTAILATGTTGMTASKAM
jgi:hypothetical protein